MTWCIIFLFVCVCVCVCVCLKCAHIHILSVQTRDSTVCCLSCSHCCWSSLEMNLQATTAQATNPTPLCGPCLLIHQNACSQKLHELAVLAEKESLAGLEKLMVFRCCCCFPLFVSLFAADSAMIFHDGWHLYGRPPRYTFTP